MPYIESEIWWGTGNDNVLSFAHPHVLDDARTWRRPAPGSRRVRNAAGTTDSWVNKRDYLLAGRVRHFGPSAWPDVQDFLDWAGQGNAFRFVPDTRYPSFYVDDCYLDEPFDDPAPLIEESDGWQSLDVVIRQQAIDFNLLLRGLMFEYKPGKSLTDPSSMAATFTRATTAARRARTGGMAEDASGTLRDRHFVFNESTSAFERSTLVERSGGNVILSSQDLDNGTYWTTITATVSDDAVDLGHLTLGLLTDDSAASAQRISQNLTFTGNGAKGISFFVAKGTATSSAVLLVDDTAAANRLVAAITWSGDVPSVAMTTGTLDDVEYIGEFQSRDVYRIRMRSTTVTAANTNRFAFFPAATAAFGDTPTGNIYAGGFQAENNIYATSYKKTTTAAATRNADVLAFPLSDPIETPQELTVYCKFVEKGTLIDGGRILQISEDGSNTNSILLGESGGFYQATTDAGSSTQAAAPTMGQQVELRAVVGETFEVTLGQSINSATETVAAASSGTFLPSEWGTGTAKIHIGNRGGTALGSVAFLHIKIAAGTRTMAEMRTL